MESADRHSPQSDDTDGYAWQSGAQAGYGDGRTFQPAFSPVNHAPISPAHFFEPARWLAHLRQVCRRSVQLDAGVRFGPAGGHPGAEGGHSRVDSRREAAQRGLHPLGRPPLRRHEFPGPSVRQDAGHGLAGRERRLHEERSSDDLALLAKSRIHTHGTLYLPPPGDRQQPGDSSGHRVFPAVFAFPQYLQKVDYATCFIGKWHMGGESDEPQPGWDHWVMEIPMNQPAGGNNNIRLRNRGGERASDLPPPMVVDEPVNTNAN